MATVGFKEVLIGFFDDKEVVTEVHAINAEEGGTIDFKISGLGTALTTVYASDGPFFVGGKGASAPKAEINIFDLPDKTFRKITGAQLVNGITEFTSESRPPYICFIAKTEGPDGEDLYVAMAKGKFTIDAIDGKTAEDKGVEVNTDTISGDFVARKSDKLIYTKARSTEEDFTIEGLKTRIFQGYVEPVGA